MRPVLRRRVVILVVVLALPLMVVGGFAAWLETGGVERRLAWTWEHELELPGRLAVADSSLSGIDSAELREVRIEDPAGTPVIRIASISAERGDADGARVVLRAPELDLGRERLPYLELLVGSLGRLAQRKRSHGSWRIEDGRILLEGDHGAIVVTGEGRRSEVLAGRITLAALDTQLELLLSGEPGQPRLELAAPVTLPLERILGVLAAYGLVSPLAPGRLPPSVDLERLMLAPGDEVVASAVLAWPAAHPWPIEHIECSALADELQLTLFWREREVAPLVLTLARNEAEAVLRVPAGQVPLRDWLPVVSGDAPALVQAILPLALPPVLDATGSQLRSEDERRVLDLAAAWPQGTAELTLAFVPAGWDAGFRFTDAARGSLAGAIRHEVGITTVDWEDLRLPRALELVLPAAWRRLPWQGIARWLTAGSLEARREDDVLLVAIESAAGGSLSAEWDWPWCQVLAEDLDLGALLDGWRPGLTAEGSIERLELQHGDAGWSAAAMLTEASLRLPGVALPSARVEAVWDEGRLEAAWPEGRLAMQGKTLRVDAPVTANGLAWPAGPWRGTASLRSDDPVAGWHWSLRAGGLPELLDLARAEGTLRMIDGRTAVTVAHWDGAWTHPLLAAVFGTTPPTAITWRGSSGVLRFADDDVLELDGERWRLVATRNEEFWRLNAAGVAVELADEARYTLVASSDAGVLLPASIEPDGRGIAALRALPAAIPWPPIKPETEPVVDVDDLEAAPGPEEEAP